MLRAIKQDLAIKITNHTARILIDRAACQCIIDGQVKGPIVAFVHQALGD
jgi:hypothetical protein